MLCSRGRASESVAAVLVLSPHYKYILIIQNNVCRIIVSNKHFIEIWHYSQGQTQAWHYIWAQMHNLLAAWADEHQWDRPCQCRCRGGRNAWPGIQLSRIWVGVSIKRDDSSLLGRHFEVWSSHWLVVFWVDVVQLHLVHACPLRAYSCYRCDAPPVKPFSD